MALTHGLFIGLTTLDCFYRAAHLPAADEKVVASKNLLVSGGPATNAAVAFAQLGGTQAGGTQARGTQTNAATLLSAIGSHPITSLLREDLHTYGVTIADLTPERLLPPPVSSIIVTAKTGERAVVASNAIDMQVRASAIAADVLQGVDIVLTDGHQMAVGAQVARWAKERSIPVVVDAGSWKPNFETLLEQADVAIASANFFPPKCQTPQDVFAYLKSLGIAKIAITRGHQAVLYWQATLENGLETGHEIISEIEVPNIRAVDTLGAGDIFHGAFCHFYLTHTFEEALLKASRSASFACQHWGTRDWTKVYKMVDKTTDDEAEESKAL